MTIAEKILAAHAGVDRVRPGDVVTVEPDVVVFIDMNFIADMYLDIQRVAHPERLVVIFDHLVPARDAPAAAAHVLGREFVRRFGIRAFHDAGSGQGIAHQLIGEHAYALPGHILVCGDSHTCSAGAFNCAARGLGPPEIAYAACTGQTWFQCCPTTRYELAGRCGEQVTPKDVFLYLAGAYGDHTLQNLEFDGPVVRDWSIDQRRAVATMCAEVGAEFALFPGDEKLAGYLAARGRADVAPVAPDRDAQYLHVTTADVSAIEPMVALPGHVIRNTAPVAAVAGTPVQQCFIGSCCNGTLDDIRIAAEIVKGREVPAGVRLIVTPGSQAIYRQAVAHGYVQALADAGAIVTPASCGACAGLGMGVLGPGERAISASTRNFQGRMGSPESAVFLASPATVAASSLTGTITDPRRVW